MMVRGHEGRLNFFKQALWAASVLPVAMAATAGSFADGGNTLVSAMMMFLGNKEKVYILDKAEGNKALADGHPAWGAVWDINTQAAQTMVVKTNTFCSSGMHLPNGSYVTFGGNEAVARGGAGKGAWDSDYNDFDGRRAIRILNPCTSEDNLNSPDCQWYDEPGVLMMQKQRWYSAAEALADGTIVIVGGFVSGGYINRNTDNSNPEGNGGAEFSYEFYPANGREAQRMQFMVTSSGLNAYAHTYLLGSGKMLVQANISTIIWDYNQNIETPLPDMPKNVVRVYPASGAVAMLPLTPANNYTPTVLFCGGSDMPEAYWGNYAHPYANTWEYPASRDCQRLTPEPADGSTPTYEQDDEMLDGRTMGQFITLPDGKMLVINGGLNGTAGYADATGLTAQASDMPFGQSLASGPVTTPAMYDPNAPKGSRWSNAGLATSNIARLYHSSAILLPDASVLVAGSNPNVDVNTSPDITFPTEYRAEIFYPPYFKAPIRPVPTGIPNTISYGGDPFDVTIPKNSYSGDANDAAGNASVVLIRGGFTTHAMNMGQRYMQLNHTYTVKTEGDFILHVAQAPPNPNLFQPGPALLFVTINGIPSNGTMVIIGSGKVETQPTAPASILPQSVRAEATGAGDNHPAPENESGKSTFSTGALIGSIIGGVALLGLIGLAALFFVRRRRAGRHQPPTTLYPINTHNMSDSGAFIPLQHGSYTQVHAASSVSLDEPYQDRTPRQSEWR
ncbi:copper radical oxidase [Collybia nuda]|uniref:Copper radical oxidase n=1 Tax=Collybia nuda TaxID=64659 RepID=A0A9P5Y9B9_9AGAR|nr:copper radical oxidase [Collybia nuda]